MGFRTAITKSYQVRVFDHTKMPYGKYWVLLLPVATKGNYY